MYGWSDTTPRGNKEKCYLRDFVDVYHWPDEKSVEVRFVGPIHSLCWHWFRVKKWAGGYARFSKLCLDNNGDAEDHGKEVCPYCNAGIQRSTQFLWNAVIRDLQKSRPRRQPGPTRREQRDVYMLGYRCHLKDPASQSWTPVRVLEIPSSMAVKIRNLATLNKHEGRVYPLSHSDYGMDVIIERDSRKAGRERYSAQRSRSRRLTKEERGYLIHPLDVLRPESLQRANAEWKSIEPRLAESEE